MKNNYDSMKNNKDQAARSAHARRCGKNQVRTLMAPEARTKRVHKKRFAVLLAQEEREKIEINAAAMGLSASAYLRTLGLGYEPRPVVHAEHVSGLVKLGGDLVRLSELLKFWPKEQPSRGVSVMDVRRLLAQIMETRAQIADKVMEYRFER
jgi:hypothetical protein